MQLKRNVTKSKRKKNERNNKKISIEKKYRTARGELLETMKAFNTAIERIEKEMLKKALEEKDYERRYRYNRLIDFLEGRSIQLTEEDNIRITNLKFSEKEEVIIIPINHKAENIIKFYDEYLYLKNEIEELMHKASYSGIYMNNMKKTFEDLKEAFINFVNI